MDMKLEPSLDNKSVLFEKTEKEQKKLVVDGYEIDSLEVAIEDYQDLPLLDLYTDIPRIIRENDEDEMLVWGDDISDWRIRAIEALIRAGWLPEKDKEEIKKVDDFIKNNPVPRYYIPLQKWLKQQ